MESTISQSRGQYLHGPKDLRLEARELGVLSSDNVRIQIRSTTLCGSDVHYFKYSQNGSIKIKEPLCGGHEAAGVIAAAGQSILEGGDLQIGDVVAIESGVPCEDCDKCKNGRYNVCPKLRFRSSGASFPHFQGTLQEFVDHPARWCHKLPSVLSCDDGALLEPLAVSIHATRKATLQHRSSCLVLGAGAVGLMCAAVTKIEHQCRVVIADIDSGRVQFALDEGFADAGFIVTPRSSLSTEKFSQAKDMASEISRAKWPDETLVDRPDVVFECTGVETCAQASIYTVDGGGKVILVGMGSPVPSWPISEITGREIDVVSVWRYANCYPRAIEIMEAVARHEIGPDVRKIITHRFCGLESIPNAYDMASKTRDESSKLVIKAVVNL
ncbi:chaperonin 10-like protein [Aspergillus caelatus]|uniref:Chaperonin 10-like protein n=1 Tax=Aspergillus caelatus TaxID=61420 RepID=A0A5N7AIL3_9EURO|nr:chaperonin 10-like protein [Aspergillus caelatus]KAE8369028.1 chaperonin 10-like protein [Aspergillus caelatus]